MEYQIESEIRKDGSKVYYDIYENTIGRTPGQVISAPHIHSYFEIVYVTGGKMTVVFEQDDRCTLKENDILITFPNEIHGTAAAEDAFDGAPDGSICQHVVKFSPLFLYPMSPVHSDIMHLLLPLKFEGSHAVVRCGSALHRSLHQHIMEIHEEEKEREPGYEIAIRSHIAMMYTHIIRRIAILEAPHEIANETGKANVELISKALNYIEEHYQEPISMQQVAQECNLNYYHFSRLFQQYTHQGFRDYVVNLRINKARTMLLQTNASVTTVSLECGFETVSYFIKKFQSVTGMTPKIFRKSYFIDDRTSPANKVTFLPQAKAETKAPSEEHTDENE